MPHGVVCDAYMVDRAAADSKRGAFSRTRWLAGKTSHGIGEGRSRTPRSRSRARHSRSRTPHRQDNTPLRAEKKTDELPMAASSLLTPCVSKPSVAAALCGPLPSVAKSSTMRRPTSTSLLTILFVSVAESRRDFDKDKAYELTGGQVVTVGSLRVHC